MQTAYIILYRILYRSFLFAPSLSLSYPKTDGAVFRADKLCTAIFLQDFHATFFDYAFSASSTISKVNGSENANGRRGTISEDFFTG